jgi:hypothetical protein
MDIADVGQGIEAQGLGALGRGIGVGGEFMFRIQQDQQRLIDFEADSKASASITEANNRGSAALIGTENKAGEWQRVMGEIHDENATRFLEETEMSDRQRRIIEAKFESARERAVSGALFASAKQTANTAWAALEIETLDAFANPAGLPTRRQKGQGFLGELKLGGKLKGTDAIATEYSIGVEIDGKETEIPTLVPTLTKEEIALMVNDIIPNKKKIPDAIVQKAIAHAKKRIKAGKSPFAQVSPAIMTEQQKEAKEKFDEMSVIRYGSDEDGQRVAQAEWNKWVAAGQKAAAENTIENIKPLLISAIEAGDKADGYEALNKILPKLVKSGVLTEAESAEANKKLGDWMDNYVAGRFEQAKEAAKLTTHQSYIDLIPKLLNDALAPQRYDLVDQSKLLKADKELWYKYIKGSYKDSPIESTPTGHTASVGAVFAAAILEVSPKEAYDELLQARFVDRSITDEQFKWAVDKIEKPYPKHLIEDIRATFNSNLEDYNRWFSFNDKKRNQKVNEQLLAWVDKLIEQDKVPIFDFKKKMYAMSSQFRVGDDRWYDIGQIIRRGGIDWEVVGFDEDGEPVVEEVR